MGIEPTNAGITIRCVNHFATTAIAIKVLICRNKWWLRTESNRRHMDFQSIALPTELLSHNNIGFLNLNSATVRQKPGAFVAKRIPYWTIRFSTD